MNRKETSGRKSTLNKNYDNSISSIYQQKDNFWKLKGQAKMVIVLN